MSLVDFIRGRKVDLRNEEVGKIIPSSPPYRGEIVLVDGARSRVTSATVKWDGLNWTLLGLRVKNAERTS